MTLLKGSYVFMDVDYGKNLDLSGNFVKDFDQSLYVLGTIQSVNVSVSHLQTFYYLILMDSFHNLNILHIYVFSWK